MGFWDQSQLAYDADFQLRTSACVSNEDHDTDPVAWADEHRWRMASAPGFADKYTAAILNNVPNPGRDQSVISDAEIVAAVQGIRAEEGTP